MVQATVQDHNLSGMWLTIKGRVFHRKDTAIPCTRLNRISSSQLLLLEHIPMHILKVPTLLDLKHNQVCNLQGPFRSSPDRKANIRLNKYLRLNSPTLVRLVHRKALRMDLDQRDIILDPSNRKDIPSSLNRR